MRPVAVKLARWPAITSKASGTVEDIARRLICAWRLVSWSEIKKDGSTDYPLGEHAIGQFIYSADGHVAAQLSRKDAKPLHEEDWRAASQPESAQKARNAGSPSLVSSVWQQRRLGDVVSGDARDDRS
jgi:hypothetical protein